MSEEPAEIIKVDKWDSVQVKNLLDETAKQLTIEHFKYEESNLLVDIRLLLCALPVASAFFALIYDFIHPFPESAPVLKICVYAYIVLIVILTLYSTYVESNTILIGYKRGPNKGNKGQSSKSSNNYTKLKLLSKMKRFDDKYTLILESPKGTHSCTKSVGNYFDEDGVFVQERFENDVVKLHQSAKKKKQ